MKLMEISHIFSVHYRDSLHGPLTADCHTNILVHLSSINHVGLLHFSASIQENEVDNGRRSKLVLSQLSEQCG